MRLGGDLRARRPDVQNPLCMQEILICGTELRKPAVAAHQKICGLAGGYGARAVHRAGPGNVWAARPRVATCRTAAAPLCSIWISASSSKRSASKAPERCTGGGQPASALNWRAKRIIAEAGACGRPALSVSDRSGLRSQHRLGASAAFPASPEPSDQSSPLGDRRQSSRRCSGEQTQRGTPTRSSKSRLRAPGIRSIRLLIRLFLIN